LILFIPSVEESIKNNVNPDKSPLFPDVLASNIIKSALAPSTTNIFFPLTMKLEPSFFAIISVFAGL
jgi:hypothetical protein